MRCVTLLQLFVLVSVSACSPRLQHKWLALRNEMEGGNRRLGDEMNEGVLDRLRPPRVDPELEDEQPLLLDHRLQQRSDDLSTEIAAKLASGDIDPATFNPTPYEVNSPEWNLAMINFLLAMKNKGHKINELETAKSLADIHADLSSQTSASNPLVCKTAPYNECYRLDSSGQLHPIGDRRPVRILRVYKRNQK